MNLISFQQWLEKICYVGQRAAGQIAVDEG